MDRSIARVIDRIGSQSAAQTVMQVGLAIASLLLGVGIALRATAGGAAEPVRFTQLLSVSAPGDQLLMAGALVLALTPAAQVIVVLAGWLRIGDFRYAAVAAVVIAMILLGMLLGIRG